MIIGRCDTRRPAAVKLLRLRSGTFSREAAAAPFESLPPHFEVLDPSGAKIPARLSLESLAELSASRLRVVVGLAGTGLANEAPCCLPAFVALMCSAAGLCAWLPFGRVWPIMSEVVHVVGRGSSAPWRTAQLATVKTVRAPPGSAGGKGAHARHQVLANRDQL